MTQMNNKFFDDFAKMLGDASGAATGMRQEFETMAKAQLQNVSRSMGQVGREEFDVLLELAKKTEENVQALSQRLDNLEKTMAGSPAKQTKPKTNPKKPRDQKA